MAQSAPNQYPVFLSEEQRQRLDDLCRNGHAPAKKIRHAQVLLSDRDRVGGAQDGRRDRRAVGDAHQYGGAHPPSLCAGRGSPGTGPQAAGDTTDALDH